MRNLEELNGKHAGQPACVLGSGPSIKMIDPSIYKNFVCIAVNAGIVANPESDYFLTDDCDCSNWTYFLELRHRRCDVLLYEEKFKGFPTLFGDRTVFFRHRTGYHVTDHYRHTEPKDHIVQCRTSVGSAIHVAHIMGCSPIFVAGVDCCRLDCKRWFWEFAGYRKPKRLDGRRADKYRKTKDSDTDLIEILQYWRDQGSEFLNRCQVYNASPISRVDAFPKITLQQYLEMKG